LPDSDKLIVENMRRAEAESYFQTGEPEAGEKAFQSLAGDFPGSPWVYIGWGDMYCLFRNRDKMPPDYEKAEKLYREALKVKDLDESDEQAVLE
jgi:tetratricopeptide (TPR) repeat protein